MALTLGTLRPLRLDDGAKLCELSKAKLRKLSAATGTDPGNTNAQQRGMCRRPSEVSHGPVLQMIKVVPG